MESSTVEWNGVGSSRVGYLFPPPFHPPFIPLPSPFPFPILFPFPTPLPFPIDLLYSTNIIMSIMNILEHYER